MAETSDEMVTRARFERATPSFGGLSPSGATDRTRWGIWDRFVRWGLLLVACFALTGCGVLEGIGGVVAGAIVREHETEHLRCATAVLGEHVSVSCVSKPVHITMSGGMAFHNNWKPDPRVHCSDQEDESSCRTGGAE